LLHFLQVFDFGQQQWTSWLIPVRAFMVERDCVGSLVAGAFILT
jgi:hypothetical protein